MIRTKEELKDIVINYVKENGDKPDINYCPTLFLRIKRQNKNNEFFIYYNVNENKIMNNYDVINITDNKYLNYSGYNFKTEIQYDSLSPNKKYKRSVEYTKYIPELKMMEYGCVTIDIHTPKINKIPDLYGENFTYEVSEFEEQREWEFTRRHFLFRDSSKIFDKYGKICEDYIIKYSISHSNSFKELYQNELEWQKFFNGEGYSETEWGRMNGSYPCNRKNLLNFQYMELNGRIHNAEWKDELFRKGISLVEDISTECKSIYVPQEHIHSQYHPITKSRYEGVWDNSFMIYPHGYYYERVNEKWSIFRFLKRDLYSQTREIKPNEYIAYKEITSPMQEIFRVYIDNNGNAFKAKYSIFTNKWNVSREDIETLEGYHRHNDIHFYNWNEAKDNPFIEKYFGFLTEIKEDQRMASIMSIKKGGLILKNMVDKNLPNMFSAYVHYNRADELFKNWFGRPINYGTPKSLGESNCNDYQLQYLDMMIGDIGNYGPTLEYAKIALKGGALESIAHIPNEEFDEAIEFIRFIEKIYPSHNPKTFVGPDLDYEFTGSSLRIYNLFNCWKSNKYVEGFLDEYTKAVKRKSGVYIYGSYRSKVSPMRIDSADFSSLEGIDRIAREINRWCNDAETVRKTYIK